MTEGFKCFQGIIGDTFTVNKNASGIIESLIEGKENCSGNRVIERINVCYRLIICTFRGNFRPHLAK